MKTKIISVLLVLLLIISITGCSDGKKGLNLSNSSSTSSNKISDTSVPASHSSTSLDSKSENTDTQILSNTVEVYKELLMKTKIICVFLVFLLIMFLLIKRWFSN